jgi:GR25 family glycosyltransferase involved in LPS biosynthesis
MEKRFRNFNMDVTRFKAVSTDSELDVPFFYDLSPYQKYCSQSHINLWRHIINNRLPYALILEDDACFDWNWKEKLNNFSRQINDPLLDAIFLNASEPTTHLDMWVLASEQYLTAGYIITLKGAITILNEFNPLYFASDWMTSRLQTNLHSYTYFPWLIIQEGCDTTIGKNLEADHLKVLRCLKEVSYDIDNYNI